MQSEKPKENNRNNTKSNAIISYQLLYYSYRSMLIIKVRVSKKKLITEFCKTTDLSHDFKKNNGDN